MHNTEQNQGSNERRKHSRLSIYSFMHATATLSCSVPVKQQDQNEQTLYWTGLLEDISYEGAQIILPNTCREHLKEQQDVIVDIKTTFIEKLDVNINAQVKYIVPAQTHDGMQVGVQFTGLDKNPRVQDAVLKICEYGRKLISASEEQSKQEACTEN